MNIEDYRDSMIYEALIVPHESPTPLCDIKRALLTYDKVKLIDPDDRDLIPSTTYMSAISGMPFPIGMNMGAVRPMGKSLGYDDSFQKIFDSCELAVQQGLIEVVSTYRRNETQGFTLGAVPTGGYPLNTQFVFSLYRNMSQNQEFLQSAITANKSHLLSNIDEDGISLKGIGDGSINNLPALPLIEDPTLNDDQNRFITQIARARIASLVKYSGFCEMKNLIPLFPSDVFGGVVSRLRNNAQIVLSDAEEDPFWFKRNRVLEFSHEEFLDDKILDSLSIEEIIRFRSKGWGNQAEARETLFDSVASIAQDSGDNADFEEKVKVQISEYKKISDEVLKERKKLGVRIACDLGKVSLGMPSALGVLSQGLMPFASIGVTLAAGGIWALNKTKEHMLQLIEIREKEKTMKRGAGFGLHNFYSKIK